MLFFQKLCPAPFPPVSKVLVAQSSLTLCKAMDCSPPGSSVHRHGHWPEDIFTTEPPENPAIRMNRG